MKRLFVIKSTVLALISFFYGQLLNCAAPKVKEDAEITYRQAQAADVAGILALINQHAHKESSKIVILPKKFREGAIAGAIKSGKLFVAEHKPNTQQSTIIGYKKLYALEDADLPETLKQELRFEGQPASAGVASVQGYELAEIAKSAQEEAHVLAAKTVYIYDGADYTHPQFRGKGVNTALTNAALAHAKPTTIARLKQNNGTHLAIVFGLTESNASLEILGGRTRGISKAFIPFAQAVAHTLDCVQPSKMICARYKAFMPTFDPESAECVPLPDAKSVPGFGCLLACSLAKAAKQPVQLTGSAVAAAK